MPEAVKRLPYHDHLEPMQCLCHHQALVVVVAVAIVVIAVTIAAAVAVESRQPLPCLVIAASAVAAFVVGTFLADPSVRPNSKAGWGPFHPHRLLGRPGTRHPFLARYQGHFDASIGSMRL